jgi:hypothetical protein
MNLKACFTLTGVVSGGVVLVSGCAGVPGNNSIDSSQMQILETRWSGTPTKDHSINTFARTACGSGLTVKVARRANVWVTGDGSKLDIPLGWTELPIVTVSSWRVFTNRASRISADGVKWVDLRP